MDARRELAAAAEALDRHVSRLAELVGESALILTEDERKAVAKTLDMQRALLGGVAAQIAAAESQVSRGASAALIDELNVLLAPAKIEAAPETPSDALAATPVRTANAAPRDTTPTNQAIDFDAFPHTPTIEQLGFSRGALDVVGEDRYRIRAIGAKRSIALRHDSSPATRPSPCAPSAGVSMGSPLVHDAGLCGSSSFGSSMSITGLLAHPDALDSRGSDPRGGAMHASRPRAAGDASMTDSTDVPLGVATSPFGGASSTIFGGNAGRPSDALSATSISHQNANFE